jgi:hypothetical protein
METDLSTRLHLYVTAAERPAGGAASGCADALSSWRAATAGHSASIICSHTRVLHGDGEDGLEALLADKQADADTEKPKPRMPLHPGENSVELLAQGAEGVIILKARNG